MKIIIDLSNVTHGINVPIALGYNTASRMLKIPSNQQTNLSRPRPYDRVGSLHTFSRQCTNNSCPGGISPLHMQQWFHQASRPSLILRQSLPLLELGDRLTQSTCRPLHIVACRMTSTRLGTCIGRLARRLHRSSIFLETLLCHRQTWMVSLPRSRCYGRWASQGPPGKSFSWRCLDVCDGLVSDEL